MVAEAAAPWEEELGTEEVWAAGPWAVGATVARSAAGAWAQVEAPWGAVASPVPGAHALSAGTAAAATRSGSGQGLTKLLPEPAIPHKF